jgi:hypothetical protein
LKSAKPIKITDYLYGLSALAFLIRLCLFVVNAPFIEGDTSLLVNKETSAIRRCLSEGYFSGCPGSGDFPLLQNVPSLVLSYLGVSGQAILHTLAYLSFLSFVGSILLIYWTLKRKASVALAITGALITITSPLLWYSHSTFGEMAAAFLILAFTSACLMRAPSWLTTALFVFAGSTKEIAFPFLVAVGLLCLYAESPTRERKTRAAALIAAAGLTIGVTVAFNYFRFGTLFNGSYASNLNIVPAFRLQLSFFMGMWFSPNGGLALFWPSFMLLYLAVLGAALLRIARTKSSEQNIRSGQEDLRFYAPLVAITAILFLLSAGFARWYTPLGGFAWGPRYMLPWIPALSLLLIYFYRDELSGILRLILHRRVGLVLSALVIFVVSVPQFSILFGEFVLAKIFAYPECPRVPVIQEGAAYYFQCLQTQIWPRRMIILELYRVALKPPALWFSILCGAVVVTGLLSIRKQLLKDEIALKASSSIAASLAAAAAMLRRWTEKPVGHSLFVVVFYSLVFVGFFFPAIYQGHLLAIGGDGSLIYLPNFYSHKVLWDTLLFSGFPMMADPQVMTWYPPAFLLSLLPGAWNVFMILAYVAGSSFMYGYVHTLTRSRFAALTSGLIFGLSGFMLAHLGHAIIVHAACWIPLIIWALERLRQQSTARWLLIGVVAVTLCFLGGQPQIFFYALMLSGAYAVVLGWSAPTGRWRYYLASLLMVILGISLAAIQIIPTAELLRQGARAGYSFRDFASHALPPRQALTMIFPASFGALPESGALPYFGAVNQTELTGYVGLLSLMLAALGVIAAKKRGLAWFWLGVAVVAFSLTMGDATPLARLIYQIPILNSFRAPARHFIELTMAASVLSGLAVAAILRQEVSARLIRRTIMIAAAAMVVFVILLFTNSSYMTALAAQKGIAQLSLLPWKNRSVGIPIVIFLLGAAVLAYWHGQPASEPRRALLLLILIVDLGSFGWFYEWRYASPDKSELNAPAVAVRYKNTLNASHQRLMPYRGSRGSIAEMPPNLSRLWGVPSASGYDALVFSRVSNLLPMIDIIGPPLPWNEPENKSLDLMAARYFFVPQNEIMTDSGGVAWFEDDAQFWLGSGCNQLPRRSATLNLPTPFKSTALAIVSRLACSVQIPDGAEVVRVRLADVQGKVETRSLSAGRDSSEWAYDCGGVTANMRHRRASIFGSYPSRLNDAPCEGHYYLTTLKLDGVKEIKSVEFEWVGGPGAIILDKLSLIDEQSGKSFPIDPALMESSRWRLVEEMEGARVYENLHAMPRAWLAPEVLNLNPNHALDAIKTGRLPDGRGFDPSHTALIETPLVLNSKDADSKASATVASLSATRMEVRTSSTRAGFLVTSDAYYPGWRASIDSRDAWLYRADYAIRGVMVPAGEHTVRFDYRPRSFYLGAGISLVSMLLLCGLAFGARWFGLGGTR